MVKKVTKIKPLVVSADRKTVRKQGQKQPKTDKNYK